MTDLAVIATAPYLDTSSGVQTRFWIFGKNLQIGDDVSVTANLGGDLHTWEGEIIKGDDNSSRYLAEVEHISPLEETGGDLAHLTITVSRTLASTQLVSNVHVSHAILTQE